jgi:hypothetical protein
MYDYSTSLPNPLLQIFLKLTVDEAYKVKKKVIVSRLTFLLLQYPTN